MVLNAAARFVVGAGKFQHITPVLRDVLHWLPVRQRILYKVAASLLPPSTVSVALALHTSSTSARRLQTWSGTPPFC